MPREKNALNETTNRLYNDLAWLWPMWGDPGGDYDYGNMGPTSYNLSHGPTASWDVSNGQVVGMFDRVYWGKMADIRDGSNLCADMAVHNFVGDSFRGATWVSLHNGGGVGWGEVINGGFGMVLDGSQEADARIQNDPIRANAGLQGPCHGNVELRRHISGNVTVVEVVLHISRNTAHVHEYCIDTAFRDEPAEVTVGLCGTCREYRGGVSLLHLQKGVRCSEARDVVDDLHAAFQGPCRHLRFAGIDRD